MIVILAVLGVVGQVLGGVLILVALAALAGSARPAPSVLRRLLWGYELWAAFVVAAIATGGSLFFSEIAQLRSVRALLVPAHLHVSALDPDARSSPFHGDHRVARYLMPLPVVGAGVSVYHLLIENKVIAEPAQCLISSPGGCGSKWINEFGYMTIPTLALTAFVLLIGFLALAAARWRRRRRATLHSRCLAARRARNGGASPQRHRRFVRRVAQRDGRRIPKVLAIVGGVVVLAAIGIGLAVLLGGGSKKPAASSYPAVGTLTNALPGASDVNTLFKGIPQSGFTLGSAKAPVTMVEYIDLQCPFCQQFETQVMPDIVPNYVRTGKVKVELRVLDFIGPDSSRGREALIAAASQNKAFNFAELLYDNQATENTGWLNDAMVGAGGLEHPRRPRAAGAEPPLSRFGGEAGAHVRPAAGCRPRDLGTPTLLVGKSGTKGTEVASPTDEQSVVTALDAALAA